MTYILNDRFSLNHYIIQAESKEDAMLKYYNFFLERNSELVEDIETYDGDEFTYEFYKKEYEPLVQEVNSDVFEIITYS